MSGFPINGTIKPISQNVTFDQISMNPISLTLNDELHSFAINEIFHGSGSSEDPYVLSSISIVGDQSEPEIFVSNINLFFYNYTV